MEECTLLQAIMTELVVAEDGCNGNHIGNGLRKGEFHWDDIQAGGRMVRLRTSRNAFTALCTDYLPCSVAVVRPMVLDAALWAVLWDDS